MESGPITWRGIQKWISIWLTPRALPLSALHSTHPTSTAYAANQTSSPETQSLLPCISGNFSSLSAKTKKEDTPEAGLAPAPLQSRYGGKENCILPAHLIQLIRAGAGPDPLSILINTLFSVNICRKEQTNHDS